MNKTKELWKILYFEYEWYDEYKKGQYLCYNSEVHVYDDVRERVAACWMKEPGLYKIGVDTDKKEIWIERDPEP